jgi:hypothetical protein
MRLPGVTATTSQVSQVSTLGTQGCGSVDDQKLKKIYSCKTFLYFLDRKLQFTYP